MRNVTATRRIYDMSCRREMKWFPVLPLYDIIKIKLYIGTRITPASRCYKNQPKQRLQALADISRSAYVFLLNLTGSCPNSVNVDRYAFVLQRRPIVLYMYVYIAMTTKPVNQLQIRSIVHKLRASPTSHNLLLLSLRKRQHPYQLPTIEFLQRKNSFINRCLFKFV